MRKTGHGKDVRHLRREPRIRVRCVLVIELRLVRRLHAEEGRVVGSLAVNERHQALIGQFFFAAIRDLSLRRALQSNIPLVGEEVMRGQIFYKTAAFYAADSSAPAVFSESICETRAERISSVAPQILRVVRTVDLFLEIEAVDLIRLSAIGKARQHAWEGQRDISRIFRLPERLPLCIFCRIEYLCDVPRQAKLREVGEIEQLRRSGGDKRSVRGCRHLRHAAQQIHILCAPAEIGIAEERSKRSTAKDAEFLFVDLFEERTLVKLRSALQILQEIPLRGVEDLDLEHHASLALIEK